MSRLLRPVLTLLLTVGLFFATSYMVYANMLKADIYLATWMQIVGMCIAFYFGERAALKKPGKDD